ncbi:glutathione S-transferase family protein [Shimia sp.]|uniref:glutathione S-transferase family protein n=1 Tax=Shimia sp. TaxID=1954381 RepID=UPI003299F1FA
MLKLYHGATSVCSAKVRIGLAELGTTWSGQILDLGKSEQNESWYLKLNPKGVVPTIVVDDFCLVESSVILEYLEESDGRGLLTPQDIQQRARAKMYLYDCIEIHAAINTMTFSTSKRAQILATQTAEEIDASIARMASPANAVKRRDIFDNGVDSPYVVAAFFTLKLLLDRMQADLQSGPWVMGEKYCIADASIIAYIDRLDRLGLAGLWKTRAPAIEAWLTASRTRPSYKTAIEDFAGPAKGDRDKNLAAGFWDTVEPRWQAFLAKHG